MCLLRMCCSGRVRFSSRSVKSCVIGPKPSSVKSVLAELTLPVTELQGFEAWKIPYNELAA